MKIYSNGRQNIFVNSAMVVAGLAGVQVEEIQTTEAERKEASFIKKFGQTKCPALETEHGNLTESVAICKYFARLNEDAKLLGSNDWEHAQVDQWLAFTHTSLLQQFIKVAASVFGFAPTEQEAYNEALKNAKNHLKVANDHLDGKTYLVGERLTVADVVLASFVQLVFQLAIETNQRKQYAHLVAWFERVSSNEHYIKRNGKIVLCARPAKAIFAPSQKPKEEGKKKGGDAKKGGEKKEEAKKPVEEKKEKEINPLDALPPSSFNMFDFKTFFVNEPDQKGKGCEELFKQFDPAGYQFWFAEYEKYEGEGEVLYQTQNLMNGFLQRADHFRKHAWGTIAIVGEEPKLDIVSVWMFRGHEIPQEMIDHP